MLPFYDRPINERIHLTEHAIENRSTVMERWAALEEAESRPWSARSSMAAVLLQGEPSVADFGCGRMKLEPFLAEGQVYIPIDVVARDQRTLVCDLNKEPIPATSASAAALLGLIEYLHDPAGLFKQLARAQTYRTVVVSYCIADAPGAAKNRRAHAWVNDFTAAQFEALVAEAGWRVGETQTVGKDQRLWRLQPTNVL